MNKPVRFSASLLLIASLVTACGGQSSAKKSSTAPAAASASAAAPVAQAASATATQQQHAAHDHKHEHKHDQAKEDHKKDEHKHVHWSYKGKDGAEHWGDLSADYEMCKLGQNQSPVNIQQSDAHMTGETSLNRQQANVPYELVNNGHTIQANPLKFGNSLKLNGDEFILRQFHFHTPSEHTFQNQHYPMEIHFVHQNATGQLAVLGVMVAQGAENPALTPFIQTKLETNKPVKHNQNLDIASLFPQNTAHFRLTGSLTTPPCSEGVNWVMFTNPVFASEAQITALRALMGENNRPVQPLNARLVVGESR